MPGNSIITLSRAYFGGEGAYTGMEIGKERGRNGRLRKVKGREKLSEKYNLSYATAKNLCSYMQNRFSFCRFGPGPHWGISIPRPSYFPLP